MASEIVPLGEAGSGERTWSAAPTWSKPVGRLVVRASSAYLLGFAGILRDLFDQDFTRGLIYIAFAHANTGYLDHVEGGGFDGLNDAPKLDQARAIRPHKIAMSLGIARETVRRKTAELIAGGFLRETGDGMVAITEFVASDLARATILANSALVLGFCQRLAGFGVCAPPLLEDGPGGRRLPHRTIVRLSMGYFLRSMDDLRGLFDGDLVTGLIFHAIIDANSADWVAAGGAGRDWPGEQVFENAKRPVSALRLASRLCLPRETVRRHVRKLETLGICQPVRGGVIIPQSTLRQDRFVGVKMRNAANVRLFLRQLRDAGVFPRENAAQSSYSGRQSSAA
jgi:hypothetical protein